MSSRSRLRLPRSRENSVRNLSNTRKIIVGWKHKASACFQAVALSKGGGSHSLDVLKTFTLEQLLQVAHDTFFPHGKCLGMNLFLKDLDSYMGNYQSEKLPDVMDDNIPFTVGGYALQRPSPVRVYMCTSVREQKAGEELEIITIQVRGR